MAAKASVPNCADCGRPVHEKAIIAEGKVWHVYHFRCVKCKKGLPSGEYCSHDGQIYCKECHKKLMSAECAKCGQPVQGGQFYVIKEQRYHPACLVCATCQTVLPDGVCYPLENKVYCLTHFCLAKQAAGAGNK